MEYIVLIPDSIKKNIIKEVRNKYYNYNIKFLSLEEFIGKVKTRLHIGFDDPSHAVGTDEFIWSEFIRVRDEIKAGFYKFYIENIKNN